MKRLLRFTCIILSVFLFTSVFAFAANEQLITPVEWEKISADFGVMGLTPGADETELNFAWLSELSDHAPQLKLAESADMKNAVLLEVESKATIMLKNANKATATDLDEGKTYYYSYTQKGAWTTPCPYTVRPADGLKVLFVSDAQIGRSGDEKLDSVLINDTSGWHSNLSSAFENVSDIAFILSAGDQVESGYSLKQYNAFRSPEILRSVPVASAIGNHDFYFPLYSYCFNNPNSYKKELFASPAGRGYYFAYGEALFIVINSNNMYAGDCERLIKTAIREYPETKWKIVLQHHTVYSSGDENGDFSFAREIFVPVFDAYSIDLVLSGHTHTYTRSHPMRNFEKANAGQGTVYIEASSASGSNYRSPSENPADYVAAAWQERVPSYTILEFKNSSVLINSYRSDTNEKIDSEYELLKNENREAENYDFFVWLVQALKKSVVSLINLIFQ